MNPRSFTLDELCTLTDLPRRTVRYYVQIGLVPRPAGGPPDPATTWPDPPPLDVEEVSHPGGDTLTRGLVRPLRASAGGRG